MQKIIILALLVIAAWGSAYAQEDLSTHFMRHTWQANRTNPALFPNYKVAVGLPGFYNSLYLSNITYNDVVVDNKIDPNAAIAVLDERDNIIRENLDIETINVGVRLGKFGLSFGHAARFNAFLNYPKALPQLIWQGNAQFIGETVDFAPDIDLFSYQEFSLGVMYDINPNFSIGGKVKLLSGSATTQTTGNRLQLTTSDDVYQLTLDADYTVNTSSSLDYNGFDEVEVNFDFGTFDGGDLFSQNTGIAFDLGARFAFDKFEFAASVIDLGASINWEEEVNNYSLTGVSEFKGLEFADEILEDSTEFGSVLDTLESFYDFTETSNAFSTTLPTRFYLSATYQIRSNWTGGIMFYSERYREETFPALALGTNIDLLPFLNVGGVYAMRSGTFDNLGLNATIKLGPVQLLAATDNIFTALQPKDSNAANLRVGLNLLFGEMDLPERLNGGASFY
jgi:hypothetical protein